MPLPEPEVPLTDICAVVFNNTLYTYSADAFQSLELTRDAEWTTLPQGERVTGGVCVGATTGVDATSAFFVVGGTSSSAEYQGIQKFTYATGQWESLIPQQHVTQQRMGHRAVYLNSTDSILVYGGSQEGTSEASSQSFTLGASAPHRVTALRTDWPPAANPILLPWSAGEAVLVGGTASDNRVMLFSPDAHPEHPWQDSGATLSTPIAKDTTAVKAALMTGDDGSKHLFTFDMTKSPNSVQRVVLFNGPGIPVQNAEPVAKRTSGQEPAASHERREALTTGNWPTYNSTRAPKNARGDYALAQGPGGLVVIAGGSADDTVVMFDAKQNRWEDTEQVLGGQVRILGTKSSTAVSSTTATRSTSTTAPVSTSLSTSASESSTTAVAATATPSSTEMAAPVAGRAPTSINTILAVVLSSFFGLAIALIVAYLCVKKRRKRLAHLEAGHARRSSGASFNEKSGVGYASDSLPRELNGPGVFRGHQAQGSHSSFSSVAILMGRINQQKPGLSSPTRTMTKGRKGSDDSTLTAFKSTISKPIPQDVRELATAPARPLRPSVQAQFEEDKGGGLAPTNGELRPRNGPIGAAISDDDSTRRSSGWNGYWSGGPALNLLGFGGGANRRATAETDRSSHYSDENRMTQMTQDSATVPPLHVYEPRASFSRVAAHSPTIAHYHPDVKESMSGQIETQRPVSAVSSMSGYSSGIPTSVHEAWDPTEASRPWGAGRGPNNSYGSGIYSTPLAPATHNWKPPTQALPRQKPAVRDDMSWLNLGDGAQ